MQKPIAIVSQNPRLKEKFDALEEAKKPAQEQIAFLKKRIEDIETRWNESAANFWKEVESECKEQKILPEEFKEESHHFHYDRKFGLLCVCDGKHDLAHAIAQNLGTT
jgi:hypothetical protein